MVPVLKQLANTDHSFVVILFGTSRSLNIADKLAGSEILDGADMTGLSIDNRWDRNEGLPDDKLRRITQAYQPKVVITGASTKLQVQFAKAYQATSQILAYYDNYGPIDNISYAPIVRKLEEVVDGLMVPSTSVAKTAKTANVLVVGQPALERTLENFKTIDSAEVYKKTGLKSNRPIVSFFGGYDPEYKAVLTTFVKGIKAFPEVQAVIRPHPKAGDALERDVVADEKCSNCIISTTDMTTPEAVSLSDVVVCHHSTVGIQAIFLGKSVVYVDVPGNTFTNPDLSEWHFSPQVTNVADFKEAMKEATKKDAVKPDELFALAGIPRQGADRVVEVLMDELKNGSVTTK